MGIILRLILLQQLPDDFLVSYQHNIAVIFFYRHYGSQDQLLGAIIRSHHVKGDSHQYFRILSQFKESQAYTAAVPLGILLISFSSFPHGS